MEQTWNALRDYSVTIDAYEVLGNVTDQHEMFYAFRKPGHARLDVVKGARSGSTIIWDGGERVTAFKRSLSFFKMHADAWDKNLTSLRGNGILSPNMGAIVACFDAHREALHERTGPVLDGDATIEIELPYTDVVCPYDSAADRGVITRDVLDVSESSGLILQRMRYQGNDVVERWELSDYKLDSEVADSSFN